MRQGLTFDKPELVPFRLTQNMIDAFGAYGYNGMLRPDREGKVNITKHTPGPFRRTCEISLGLLRQNEDALMTVLETFLHDPTTDFIGRKVRTQPIRKSHRYSCFKAPYPCKCPRDTYRRLRERTQQASGSSPRGICSTLSRRSCG